MITQKKNEIKIIYHLFSDNYKNVSTDRILLALNSLYVHWFYIPSSIYLSQRSNITICMYLIVLSSTFCIYKALQNYLLYILQLSKILRLATLLLVI